MNYDELKSLWELEEKAGFTGWDFTHLEGRWQDEELSWDYKTIVNTFRKSCDRLLDMGTGGGEFLLTLKHPYYNMSVTESWEPNFLLCKEKLEPLGISVRKVINDAALPFEDNTFDLIINRHESYDLSEVKRILKPKGLFITQQVGGKNDNDLSKRLIDDFIPEFPEHDLDHQTAAFKNYGFEILMGKEEFPKLKFFDVGAVVYFAKIIPWEFPQFSVDKCFDKLLHLNAELLENGYIECMEHRFIIATRNCK